MCDKVLYTQFKGGGGRGMFGCVSVCVCVRSVSYMVLSLMGGGTPKFGANLEGVCSS